MRSTTQTAATSEQAIQQALKELGIRRDQASIKILDEGKKGFLGLGAKPAVVIVNVKDGVTVEETPSSPVVVEETKEVVESAAVDISEQPIEAVSEQTEPVVVETPVAKITNDKAIEESIRYMKEVAQGMGINDLDVTHEVEGKYVHFQLNSSKAAQLIGKRGQTLNALENLVQLVANKYSGNFMIVKMDVENYREKRKVALEQLAERMADKARRSGEKVEFEPMNAYERKIIHNALSTHVDIDTYSVGADPHRHLVIEPIQ
ncbi:RNA-binding cell elongation regulator Jag/EloR [Chryseomicrobium aureum]|uniref:RNA-binding cell elongation regulator Jag/EloR n=1 Tax=Chryseomicrobium aureum TaxID=1441723 RepID=UPI0019560EE2|nr:RNA-binding cell elongation regulator Jag/EloR [Chryseomicrobium aureum]MBM7707365.1 spoIIIJ-associated protein [Chryseomicrobium aureum]